MNKKLKRYLTDYIIDEPYIGRRKMEGVSILAFSWKEAITKLMLHNKFSNIQLRIVGEWVETIEYE